MNPHSYVWKGEADAAQADEQKTTALQDPHGRGAAQGKRQYLGITGFSYIVQWFWSK